jgi:U3 small nucleolar RNA-associated protein 19
MPFLEMESKAGKKRKRVDNGKTNPSKIQRAESSDDEHSLEEEVLELEAQVLESRKHYNNIPKLLSLAQAGSTIRSETILPAVALCRIYCRLYAHGTLAQNKAGSDSEEVIVQWLRERLREYIQLLVGAIADGAEDVQSTALTLLMRLVKEEVTHDGYATWSTGIFRGLIISLIGENGPVLEEFCEKYFTEFDDVRLYTLAQVSEILKTSDKDEDVLEVTEAAMKILGELDEPNENESEVEFYVQEVAKDIRHLVSSRKQRKAVQAAWLAVLKSPLSKQQNKQILGILVDHIVPWFNKVELLMDYLTDSYNTGGATSLLALSGLFHLMQERNLDYPSFYEKLYSLLDEDILHSKHRSRFFRLLDTFMGSTHLPAALVASFIKRLSRLSLHAPPAGIVVVVPWIYNMFKQHPQCTFMIHRARYTSTSTFDPSFTDPFDSAERDPMETNAMDSSIWEIVTLQSHWHPNVATLAKIISEQFTKQNYNLEDFLDHSYNSLLDAEVAKEMKKTPVVEWEIPKTVFVAGAGDGENNLGTLMGQLHEISS